MAGLSISTTNPTAHLLGELLYPLSMGMVTLEQTRPVSVRAAFSKPSVPALCSISPSGLNLRHLQLPSGCLRVRQAVSASPRPFSEAADDNRRDLDRLLYNFDVVLFVVRAGIVGRSWCSREPTCLHVSRGQADYQGWRGRMECLCKEV